MTLRSRWLSPILVGLALRLICVWGYSGVGGDTRVYEELARNWSTYGVLGLRAGSLWVPADIRAPGYPAFLIAAHRLFGPSALAVKLPQVAIDLLTCILTAKLASRLVPEAQRDRVAVIAAWLAALCPFTAVYTAYVLTETWAIFLTVLAIFPLVKALSGDEFSVIRVGGLSLTLPNWLLGGFATGLGALFRPDASLVLPAALLLTLFLGERRSNPARILKAVGWMVAAWLLLLMPWVARNWISLGRFQLFSVRYDAPPGEYVPRGFYAWAMTWLARPSDLPRTVWKVMGKEGDVSMQDLPPTAFDSPQEQERVATLLARSDRGRSITPIVDTEFGGLAGSRASRHPLRTYLSLPLERAASMWFAPRFTLQGRGRPVRVGLWLLGFVYVTLAVVGVWRGLSARAGPATAGVWLLATVVIVRTLVFAQFAWPEPRYMVECLPAVMALGAVACHDGWWLFGKRREGSGPSFAVR